MGLSLRLRGICTCGHLLIRPAFPSSDSFHDFMCASQAQRRKKMRTHVRPPYQSRRLPLLDLMRSCVEVLAPTHFTATAMSSASLRHLSSNLATSVSRSSSRCRVHVQPLWRRDFSESARLLAPAPESSSPGPEPQQSSKAGSSTVKQEKVKESNPESIAFLSQPLGVRTRPDGTTVTWKDTVFDSDLRMERRQKL